MAVTLDAAADLSLSLIRIMKLFQSMRHHAPRLHPAVEASAYPVLFNLHAGPKRVSELADCVHSDVSTVSRQATAIVSHGLAEKVTDPADGRAQVITLTPEGIALLERIKDQRARWFQEHARGLVPRGHRRLHGIPRALRRRTSRPPAPPPSRATGPTPNRPTPGELMATRRRRRGPTGR